jgi:hypothetical protein
MLAAFGGALPDPMLAALDVLPPLAGRSDWHANLRCRDDYPIPAAVADARILPQTPRQVFAGDEAVPVTMRVLVDDAVPIITDGNYVEVT